MLDSSQAMLPYQAWHKKMSDKYAPLCLKHGNILLDLLRCYEPQRIQK